MKGFSGDDCENTPCDPPCENGGQCTPDGNGGHFCDCGTGIYTGDICNVVECSGHDIFKLECLGDFKVSLYIQAFFAPKLLFVSRKSFKNLDNDFRSNLPSKSQYVSV